MTNRKDKWESFSIHDTAPGVVEEHGGERRKKPYRYPGPAKGNRVKIYSCLEARLSPNLLISKYFVASFDKRHRTIRLRAADSHAPGRLEVTHPGGAPSGRISLEGIVNKIGATRFDIANEFKAWVHDDSVFIDLNQVTSSPDRDDPMDFVFRPNSTRGIAFAMCKRGTTITALKALARDRGVRFGPLFNRMLESDRHGHSVIQNDDFIKLLPRTVSTKTNGRRSGGKNNNDENKDKTKIKKMNKNDEDEKKKKR